MLLIKQLFLGLLLPAVVSGAILIFTRSRGSRTDATGQETAPVGFSGWWIAAALAIGYIVGYIGIEGLPVFPPRLGPHWLFYFAAIGLAVAGFLHFSGWVRVVTQIVLAITFPRLLLTATFKYTWGPLEGIIWWVCLAIAIFIFWHLVEQSFSILPSGGTVPFVYFGIFGGTALILAVSGSLRLAQHGGVFAAIFAAIWIITRVQQRSPPSFVLPLNAASVVTLLLVGLWMNGYFFSDMPGISALLLLISPLFARVGQLTAVQKLSGQRSTMLQIAAIALPVLIAIGITIARAGFFDESSGY